MPTAVMIEVFKYEELSDQAKERAREEEFYRDRVFEDVLDTLKYRLEERGLSQLELHYDISFCQGDGIGFSGSVNATEVDDTKFVSIIEMLIKRSDRIKLPFGVGEVSAARPAIDAVISIERAHHQHAPSCFGVSVEFEVDEDNQYDGIDDEATDDEAIVKAVKDYFKNLSDEMYREATDALLEDPDDEWVADLFARWRFNEDGSYYDTVDED